MSQATGTWKVPRPIENLQMMEFDSTSAMPWHVTDYHIDTLLWPAVKGREIIGLVDTGISQTHLNGPELSGQVLHAADFTNSRFGPYDKNGHGSWCCGCMVANTFGIGKHFAKVVSAKALGDSGYGSEDAIAKAIHWCLDNGATIINMSLGSPEASPVINAALLEASQQGVLVVCAAGNDSGPVNQPAAQPFVLSDSAITRERTLATFSCYGPENDLCGPGVEMTSLDAGGGYRNLSGTSMSSPHVSAMLCAIRAFDVQRGVKPPSTVAEWTDRITLCTDDLGVQGRDAKFGLGVLNVSKILEVAAPPIVVTPPSPPTPTMPPAVSSIGMAMTPDGKNWWRVPAGTKLEPLKVQA